MRGVRDPEVSSMQRPCAFLLALGASLLALALAPCGAAPIVRVKDLTDVEGVRSNPLVGYGLVVGLKGTGDGTQAQFTIQSLANLLRRSGVTVPISAIRVRNVAAAMVTADLPPFARPGQPLDVLVSSMGDAKSLEGGTLLMTPLQGPDGNTYAVAQGAVSLGGGFTGGTGGNSIQKNHPTAGRIPSGATVERGLGLELGGFTSFRLLLRQPDFATAERIAGAINGQSGDALARAIDSAAVTVELPAELADEPVALLAGVEALEIQPDAPARVVINERTGTVVVGADVRISKVALAHGNLTIEVRTEREASQPAPFSERGRTVVVEQPEVFATEGPDSVLTLEEGVSVGELVDALNELGISARDMIAIFQAMRAAGALHAELVLL
jgi:flagellar P-ring protein precursor FlgI